MAYLIRCVSNSCGHATSGLFSLGRTNLLIVECIALGTFTLGIVLLLNSLRNGLILPNHVLEWFPCIEYIARQLVNSS